MDFDPLELFTATPVGFGAEAPENLDVRPAPAHTTKFDVDSEDEHIPLDVHDLPLLQCKPPAEVLILFLKLLAPAVTLNFDPTTSRGVHHAPDEIYVEKDVAHPSAECMIWLSRFCPRFHSSEQLASIALLSSSLKANCAPQYNAWLTRLIAHDLAWASPLERETVKKLASLRLAENCGRTAQPEIIRKIEIPFLAKNILLKEPSLTSDNLGLKTWGSSFILGCRLARDFNSHKTSNYLYGSVLELGAGTGLVGIVSCALGYTTTLTDLPEITPNLSNNLELNEVYNGMVSDLDWAAPESFLQRFPDADFSTIILSDPLYSSEHHFLIVNMVNKFLKDDSLSRVLIQIPQRRSYEKERAALWTLMEDNGYVVVEEDIESGFDDFGESSFIFKKYARKL